MVEGQARDMAGKDAALGEAAVMELCARKTGALLAAPVPGGAPAPGAERPTATPVGLSSGLPSRSPTTCWT